MSGGPDFAGLVLAGGHSRRMGTDKAALPIAQEPLLARQVRLLQEAGASEVLVSLRPRQQPAALLPTQVRIVRDQPEGIGPLGGLAAGLAAWRTSALLVVAVDLPALTADFLRRLTAAAQPGVGVVPVREGFPEPLIALYPEAALSAVQRQIAAGRHAVQDLVRSGLAEGWLRPWPVSDSDRPCLHNWNTPEDQRTG